MKFLRCHFWSGHDPLTYPGNSRQYNPNICLVCHHAQRGVWPTLGLIRRGLRRMGVRL